MGAPLTSIALPVVVSLFPFKVRFRPRIILVTIIQATTTVSSAAVLVPLLQPTGGLVDICKLKTFKLIEKMYNSFCSMSQQRIVKFEKFH